MKKNNTIIVAMCVVIVALCTLLAVVNLKHGKNIETQTEISSQIKKAKEIPNAIRFSEGRDFSFNDEGSAENNEVFSDEIKELNASVFDYVFLKTKTFMNPQSEYGEISKTIENINSISSLIKKKTIFVEYDISVPVDSIKTIFENQRISGILIRNINSAKPGEINKTISDILALSDKKIKIAVELEENYKNTSKLKFNSIDYICANLNKKDEDEISDFFDFYDSVCEEFKTGFIPFFRADFCNEEKADCSYLLDCVRTAENYDNISIRGFSTFSDIEVDKDNSFSAVEKFIRDGIDVSVAMAKLNIEGYDGKTITKNDYRASIVITGSDVFPLYFENEKLYLSEGKTKLDLSLKNGMNKFVLTQAKSRLVYKVKVEFNGELIQSIDPGETINLTPGKTSVVIISAAAGADVTVKMGAKKITAKQIGDEKDGYCKFLATVTAPKTEIEINSLGKLMVSASLNGETSTKNGPDVVCSDISESPSQNENNEEKLTIDNFIESPPVIATTAPPTTSAQVIPQDYVPAVQYTGNQMCIVNAYYADTWSPNEADADYIPYYTTLANGTIDYVVGQCQIYDAEEAETRDFYILASGRKVQTKSVQLIQNQNYGDNSIFVTSTQGNNGELEIRMKTDWRVPYSFSFAPQEYYSSHNKKYNVQNFTPDKIQFTFYHTTSATGTISADGSDVVSSGTWIVDPSKKTASLVMPLRQAGKYYGYSIRHEADGTVVLKIQNRPKALSGSVIVVDPGHGGSDGGASGLYGSVKESQINFAVSVALKNELEKRGATVYLTRADDSDITLEERKSFARQCNPDLFISVHGNASVDSSRFGTAVYYFRPMSEPLSKSVFTRLYNLYASVYGSDYSRAATGSIYHPFSVTRLEECPSILIETGFVTNERECRLLLDAGNRDKIAGAIADGISDYLA